MNKKNDARLETIAFRVQYFNTLGTANDRVVATFTIRAHSLDKALDSAAQSARQWNATEGRANMIVKHVVAMGTVRDVPHALAK